MIYFEWVPSPLDLADDLEKLKQVLGNFQEPITRSINEVLAPSIQDNFNAQGRPAWKPLSAITVARKGHSDILYESGALERDATNPGSWRVDTTTGELETVPFWGRLHNTGYYNVQFRSKVPARQWAMYQTQDINETVEVFADWIVEKIEENW